jgi:hypothetical protein
MGIIARDTVQSDTRLSVLQSAPLNAWIALSDDESRLVAQGDTYEEVAVQLEKMGDETSFLVKTPPSWSLLSV